MWSVGLYVYPQRYILEIYPLYYRDISSVDMTGEAAYPFPLP